MSAPLDLGRYREPAPESLSADQQAARAQLIEGGRGSVPPPYRIWLSSPELVRRIEGLGQFLLRGSSLTSRENEIAILTAAQRHNCAFVLAAHGRVAARVGLEPALIEALQNGTPPGFSNPREQAVYDVATALQAGPPPEATYRRTLELLGQAGIADLTGLLGYYASVCYILNFHDVPRPA
jgi:4-carboxymuconolactone decarboxylase